MKVNCKIAKKFFLVPALFFVLSVFLSCINSISFDTEKKSSSNEVTFRGIINQGAAVPSEIEKALTSVQLDAAKSAVPDISGDEYQYFAYASADGVETKIGNFGTDEKSKVFEIGLVKGVRWTVVCGIKKGGAPATDDNIVFKDSFPVELDDTESVMVHTFSPVPVTGGNGSIKLEMTVNSNITKVVASCSDENWKHVVGSGLGERLIGVSDSIATLEILNIPSGVYEVTFKFCRGTSIAFLTTQSINVVKNMETNKWISDGTLDLFSVTDSVTTFNVTENVEKKFLASTIYVGVPEGVPSDVYASNENSGSSYEPLANVQTALSKIASSGNSSIDYRIFVSGTLNGNINLSEALNDKAQSITIEGLGENPTLKGTGSTSVITVATSKPVTFKNVKITGGNATNGGGINMTAGSKVTLESGALIGEDKTDLPGSSKYGNKATKGGGGIYNTQGTLVLKKGSKVCYNYEGYSSYNGGEGGGGIKLFGGSLTIYDGAVVSYNKTTTRGGGVDIDKGSSNASFVMNGGEIIHNDSTGWGGGVIMRSVNCSFDFKSGKISNNAVSGTRSDWAPNGGGIFMDGGIFTMSGDAEISYNEAALYNGGLSFVGATCEVHLNGGVIKNNKAFRGGSGAVSMGGNPTVFTMSGSISIPFDVEGDSEHKNDIELADGKVIKITGPLSRKDTNPIATIMPKSYSRGKTLVEADGINVTDLTPYKDFFAVKNTDWLVNLSADKKKLVLDAPIYVKSTGSYITTGDNKTTGSKSDPFDTIEHACSVMNDSSVDYTIYVDGEIKSTIGSDDKPCGQQIPSAVNAKSITIRGANTPASSGPVDIINGVVKTDSTKNARALTLTIESSLSVTIENLKITGGLADNGGGIYVSGPLALTLGEDVVVTGNRAKDYGGGIYFETTASEELKIKGNVKVYGNTNSQTGDASNLYIREGKKINITGALTKGTGATADKAKICVSTQADPTLEETVVFTSDYGYSAGGFNAGVVPETYFRGDKWGVTSGTGDSADEAVLAASSGQIIIEPVYEDITIKADKTSFLKSAASKVMTFSATGKDGDDEVPLTIGSGTGKVSLSYALYYHGEAVPKTQGSTTYYTTGTNTFTLGSALPVGDYVVTVTASYKDRTYSASFEVKIKDGSLSASEAIDYVSSMASGEKLAIKGTITADDFTALNTALKARYTASSSFSVDLDLSAVTGLTEIPANAFKQNNALRSVVLPDGITSICSHAFYDCNNLTTINLPAGLTEISGYVFYDCYKLTNIELPDSLRVIGSNVFNNCSKLTSISLPEELTDIGEWAFFNTRLTEITIPSTVETLTDNCLSTTDIVTATLSEGVKTIVNHAFRVCMKLEVINIPASVTSIGSQALYMCKKLTTINVSPDNTAYKSIDGVLYKYNDDGSLTLFHYPNAKGTSFTIPADINVTVIGEHFSDQWAYKSDLVELTIPASVTEIKDYALAYMVNLETINFTGTVSQWNAITKATNWKGYTGDDAIKATVVHCSDGDADI
ncbi:MAG: leucine-rich repeat domain-containing protein [Treponema sp.]|nr:leucine-rich repeat domain-containing protein [Treponema sp.]